jgi:hypothetical protein
MLVHQVFINQLQQWQIAQIVKDVMSTHINICLVPSLVFAAQQVPVVILVRHFARVKAKIEFFNPLVVGVFVNLVMNLWIQISWFPAQKMVRMIVSRLCCHVALPHKSVYLMDNVQQMTRFVIIFAVHKVAL